MERESLEIGEYKVNLYENATFIQKRFTVLMKFDKRLSKASIEAAMSAYEQGFNCGLEKGKAEIADGICNLLGIDNKIRNAIDN